MCNEMDQNCIRFYCGNQNNKLLFDALMPRKRFLVVEKKIEEETKGDQITPISQDQKMGKTF